MSSEMDIIWMWAILISSVAIMGTLALGLFERKARQEGPPTTGIIRIGIVGEDGEVRWFYPENKEEPPHGEKI